MVGSILFRMILWELCKVFTMSLVAITGILLMAGIIAEASQQGLGPAQIFAAIPLLIPSTLPYTIPATTLFSACVVYGRLSADNEILAIKANGVNLIHIVKPGLLLGLLMSLGTMGLYYEIIPTTHHRLRSMVISDAEELLYSVLRRQRMINHQQLPYAMFVKGVEGRKLISPVFKKKNNKGEIEIVAYAREADMRVDMNKNILWVHMRFGVTIGQDGARTAFQDQKFDVNLPPNFQQPNNIRARDLTYPELSERLVEVREEWHRAEEELAAFLAEYPDGVPKEALPRSNHYTATSRAKKQQVRLVEVEMKMRPALSLGCLCFILVGCPIGIWFSKGDYLSAFITCFLPIVIVYYPLMLCGTNLAKEGRFNEWALVFGADALVGFWGIVLFYRLLKN